MKRLGLFGLGRPNDVARYANRITDEVSFRYGSSQPLAIIALGLHASELTDPDIEAEHGVLRLREAIAVLKGLGADAITVCSRPLPPSVARTTFPILLPSISEITSIAIHRARIARVGLIGPRSLHEDKIWREDLTSARVTDTFVPTARDREHLNRIATTELSQGLLNESSRADLVRIVYSLRQAGARAVVVTIPEIGAVLGSAPLVLPIFDAVELHAVAAVDWAWQTCSDNMIQPS